MIIIIMIIMMIMMMIIMIIMIIIITNYNNPAGHGAAWSDRATARRLRCPVLCRIVPFRGV